MFIFSNIILFFFLSICAVTDIRTKTINIFVCALFGVAGVVFQLTFLHSGFSVLFSNLLPAIFLFLFSLLTKGAIGMGDSIIFFVAAFYLTTSCALNVLFFSLFCSAIYCIYLLLTKHSRKYAFPFAPFILSGTTLFFILTGGVI